MHINERSLGLRYAPQLARQKNFAVKQNYSPLTLYNFFRLYSNTRHERWRLINPLSYMIDCISRFYKLRVVKDENGKILAGYTYKFRKNRLDEKSMFIDALARNKSQKNNSKTKNLMPQIYDDIKKMALKHKAEEITLFVKANDRKVRKNYEKLGFKIDETCDIERAYVMRTRVKNFLETAYFKARKLKSSLGIDHLITLGHIKN